MIRDPQTFVFQNIGKTKRQGVETYLNLKPYENWRLHLDYTYQDAKYKKFIDERARTTVVMDGRRITNVPRHITNAELSFEPEDGLGGRLRYSWNADYVVVDSPEYADPWRGNDYGSLDMQLSYRFNEKYKLTLDVLNLLDKDYAAWTADHNPATGYYTYSPNLPRTVYLGLDINWD